MLSAMLGCIAKKDNRLMENGKIRLMDEKLHDEIALQLIKVKDI